MATFKKLDLFWAHSNCSKQFKLLVQDAIIRSKLLYGLESEQLKSENMHKLDVFQLKGLRKILKITTTFVDRTNTNERVYELANRSLAENCGRGEPRKITKHSEVYMHRKLKWLQDLLQAPEEDIVKQTTLNWNTMKPWDVGKKKH